MILNEHLARKKSSYEAGLDEFIKILVRPVILTNVSIEN